MLINDLEFFTYEDEVWYRQEDKVVKLAQSDTGLIAGLLNIIEVFYPDAFEALGREYAACARNIPYYNFKRVSRFIRCNFSQLDNIPDVKANGDFQFEYIPCPLRGECRYDRVICCPKFNHKLSQAELPVMTMWANGASVDEIADELCLSPHTVHNHIRNAYKKASTHTRSEFVKYAVKSGLIK